MLKKQEKGGPGAVPNMKFRYIFEAKREGSEGQNVVISLDLLQNMRFRLSRNFMKMEVKMASKMDENRSFGRPWAGDLFFWRFLEVLEKGRNLKDF